MMQAQGHCVLEKNRAIVRRAHYQIEVRISPQGKTQVNGMENFSKARKRYEQGVEYVRG